MMPRVELGNYCDGDLRGTSKVAPGAPVVGAIDVPLARPLIGHRLYALRDVPVLCKKPVEEIFGELGITRWGRCG